MFGRYFVVLVGLGWHMNRVLRWRCVARIGILVLFVCWKEPTASEQRHQALPWANNQSLGTCLCHKLAPLAMTCLFRNRNGIPHLPGRFRIHCWWMLLILWCITIHPEASFLMIPYSHFPKPVISGVKRQILFESSSAYYVASQVVMAQFHILSS